MKIGIFDSGLGGKLILDAVRQQLPRYDYAYYGDTAHMPYGERSEEQIYELTKTGVEYLMHIQSCTLVLLSCNTASAETLRRLQDEWLPQQYPDRRILGVIIPTLEAVLETDCRRVLLIGTSRTVSSGKYHLELGKRKEIETKIESISMPQLASQIQEGKTEQALASVLDLIKQRQIMGCAYDGLILGCTHYGLLADELRHQLEQNVQVFSQTEIIPIKVADYLTAHPAITATLSTGSTATEYLTGSP